MATPEGDNKMTETHKIRLFPLGVVALPEMPLPLHIFEERYKLMISECIAKNEPFGIVLFDGQSLHTVGCTVRVTGVTKRYEDGRMDIMTQGGQRFVIQKVINEKPFMEAYVNFFEDVDDISLEEFQPLAESAGDLLSKLPEQDQPAEAIHLSARSNPLRWSFAIAALEGFTVAERQSFLEMTSTADRIKKGVRALARIVERSTLTDEIISIIGGNGSPPRRLIELLSSNNQARS